MCQHHWLIGESCGTSNRQGVCKLCGEHKKFLEFADAIGDREKQLVSGGFAGKDSLIRYERRKAVKQA